MSPAEMAAVVARIARGHGIVIEWRAPSQMPAGVAAYAVGRNRIVIPGIVDAVTFAVVLHELGHCLSEPCRGGDHRPDPRVKEWSHCVRCEQLAWQKAMELHEFSPAMFRRLQWSLGLYRQTTPAPCTAIEALDRQRGTVAYREHQQRVRRHEERVRWLRAQRESLRPRPRPRPRPCTPLEARARQLEQWRNQ